MLVPRTQLRWLPLDEREREREAEREREGKGNREREREQFLKNFSIRKTECATNQRIVVSTKFIITELLSNKKFSLLIEE